MNNTDYKHHLLYLEVLNFETSWASSSMITTLLILQCLAIILIWKVFKEYSKLLRQTFIRRNVLGAREPDNQIPILIYNFVVILVFTAIIFATIYCFRLLREWFNEVFKNTKKQS